MHEQLFNVVAVNLETGAERPLTDKPLTEENADAVISMAVMRRGLDVEFYKAVPAGKPQEVTV